MSDVAIVILHYKQEDDTLECLYSFKKNTHADQRIYLVANSYNKKFHDSLRVKYPGVIFIVNRENLGFAQGINVGIKRALEDGCSFFLIVNNDTIAGPSLVSKLVGFAKKNPSVGLVSPKIYFAPGFEYHAKRYDKDEKGKVIWYGGGRIDWSNVYASHRGVDEVDHGRYDSTIDTDFATGCCTLVRRDLIEKIGLMDERYFLYFEDADYSMRAKRAGFRVVYFPQAHMWHKNASSSDKPGSSTHVYYQTRNRLYFGYTYAPMWTKKSLMWESIKNLFGTTLEAQALRDYYRGKMGRRTHED